MGLKDYGSEGLLAYWNSLTIDEREQLTHDLENYHATLAQLTGRGIVEVGKGFTDIVLLKRDKTLIEFLKLHEKLKLKGLKIIDLRSHNKNDKNNK